LISIKYLGTFFSLTTSKITIVDRFQTSQLENVKFGAAFGSRMEYKSDIKEEVKEWVAENIVRWKVEKPPWFKIERIPDDFLPDEVFEAEGGGTGGGGAASRNCWGSTTANQIIIECIRKRSEGV